MSYKVGRGVAKLCQAPRRPATHLELNPQLCAKPAEAQNLRRLGSEDELHEPAEEYSSATFASLPEEAAVLTEPIPDPKEYSPTHVTVQRTPAVAADVANVAEEYSPATQHTIAALPLLPMLPRSAPQQCSNPRQAQAITAALQRQTPPSPTLLAEAAGALAQSPSLQQQTA